MQNIKKEEPLVSIVSPVYNAENTLRRCVLSILCQTYKNWELIAVDDGSQDRSGAILDEMAASDSRIHVIHKANGGVASARQVGLENAIGDYAIHIDPDDWIEPTMLEDLVAEATRTDADIVICDYTIDYDGYSRVVNQQLGTLTQETMAIGLFQQLHGSCCNKMIKSSCYNRGKFYAGIDLSEDLLYICQVLMHARTISYLPKACYHYVTKHEESQSKIFTAERFRMLKFVYDKLVGMFENYPSILPYANVARVQRLAIVGTKAYDLTWRELYSVLGLKSLQIIWKGDFTNKQKIITTLSICGFKPLINLFLNRLKH